MIKENEWQKIMGKAVYECMDSGIITPIEADRLVDSIFKPVKIGDE